MPLLVQLLILQVENMQGAMQLERCILIIDTKGENMQGATQVLPLLSR